MRKIASLIVCCCISLSASAQLSFKISKPLCLLAFLETASHSPLSSKTLQQFIDTNVAPGDSANFNAIVRQFAALNLDRGYVLEEYPKSRQNPRSSESLIKMAAVQANTIDELFARVMGVLPNEQLLLLKKLMTDIEPYYNKMVWNQHRQPLEEQLAGLNGYTNTQELFKKIKNFYGGIWTGDMPFTVAIYPIPGKKGNTTATPHNNSLILSVLTGSADVPSQLGVVFHEIGHVFYEEQPLKLQRQLDAAFTASKSPYAQYAYSYIDEGLATACGNGWAQEQISGKPDTGTWYTDEYINRYAHAIYPMVKEYIEAVKTIDEAFITRAIALFEKEFPDAAYAYENLMNKISFYTDADDTEQYERISKTLRYHYRIYSSHSSYPVSDPQSLHMAASNQGTQFFIIHTRHHENQEELKKIFPELKNEDLKKEALISFIDKDNRAVIIMTVKNEQRIEQGLKRMLTLKKINQQQRTRSID